MKKLVIKNNDCNKTKIEAWMKRHAKSYLTSVGDLDNLATRYQKHVRRAKIIATAIATFMTSLMVIALESDDSYRTNISGILTMTVVFAIVWGLTYNFAEYSGKNNEVFDSFRKFAKDWKQLEQLRKDLTNVRDDFERLGKAIGEANRLNDGSTERKLMKKFRRDHQTLFDFGIIDDRNYGVFIPNLKKKDPVETPRALIGG